MHEIGMMYQMADMAIRYANENDIDNIKFLSVEVGELSGALPWIFTEYFPYISEEFPLLKGAELKLKQVPGEAMCTDCKCMYNVMKQEGTCPNCGSHEKKILGGREIRLMNIGY